MNQIQTELFSEIEPETPKQRDDYEKSPDISGLFELSIDAFYSALYADMSELPIRAELHRFIEKVKAAAIEASLSAATSAAARSATASKAAFSKADASIAARAAADKAATDRGDPDVLKILKIAAKVGHEIHRLMGLLRFSPNGEGVYIAHCSPDYFILPALAEHFTLRFNKTPWAIIDEKRGLCLCRDRNQPAKIKAKIYPLSELPEFIDKDVHDIHVHNEQNSGKVHWEDLWRLYHRSVTNEGKKNLRLQRQFMPERYHKYLTELH